MSDAKAPTIDLAGWLRMLYAERHGLKHGDSHADFVAALKADPDMLAVARKRAEEVAAVVSQRGQGACIVSYTHHRALTRALAEIAS